MRKVLSALAAVAVLSSCNALDSIGSIGRFNGSFELTHVNGMRLPAVLYQEPGYRLDVLNANFTLEEDGTYSEAGIV